MNDGWLRRRVRSGVLTAASFVISVLLATSAAPAPDTAGGEAWLDLLLTIAHSAAVDFEHARQRGDAEAMARAAVQRRPFDLVQVSLGEAARGIDMLTGEQMLAAARTLAQNDHALLARVEAIGRQERGDDVFGALTSGFWKGGTGRPPSPDVPVSAVQPLPRRLAVALPYGRTVAVPARSAVWLAATLVARQSLIVYAHARASTAVRLTVLNGSGASVCTDVQPHGALLCRWRTEAATQVTVVLDNASNEPARVFVSTNL